MMEQKQTHRKYSKIIQSAKLIITEEGLRVNILEILRIHELPRNAYIGTLEGKLVSRVSLSKLWSDTILYVSFIE